jgi:Icc-related predicted phosphoesterase
MRARVAGSGFAVGVLMPSSKAFVRVVAVGDIHYGRTSAGALAPILTALADLQADVLVLCGDLTDYGLPDEARGLAKELISGVKVPIVGVLGNHDFESGNQDEVRQILTDAGMTILDGDSYEVHGVGFAGVKGFCGGFGRGTLGPWGEPIVKNFVQEAINEALKLESALARLRTPRKIAVLHYAPVQATVEGEPVEIFPFLGCGRLEEPLGRFPVTAVFHGHAHNGTAEGRTREQVPVFNVSYPLMRRLFPDQPVRVLDVRMED